MEDARDILEQLGGWPVLLAETWEAENFTWYGLAEKANLLGFDTSRILSASELLTADLNNFDVNLKISSLFSFMLGFNLNLASSSLEKFMISGVEPSPLWSAPAPLCKIPKHNLGQ